MLTNKVVAGDYAGYRVKTGWGSLFLSPPLFSNQSGRVNVDKNTVLSYEVMSSNYRKSAVSGLIRGWIGKNIFGHIGMMSGLLTMREKGTHTVSVSFQGGKKSLIEICDKRLKMLMRCTF